MTVRELERLADLLGALYEEPTTREGVRNLIPRVRAEVAFMLERRERGRR